MDMLSSASNPFKLVKNITLQMLCQGSVVRCVVLGSVRLGLMNLRGNFLRNV